MFIAYNIIYFHFFVNENEITDFIEPAFLILSKRKKPLAVFIINTCLYEKSLLYGTCRRKKMVPFVENLLRDGTFRRKFRKALFSETQKCPLNRQICPLGRFIKSIFLATTKININTQKLDK